MQESAKFDFFLFGSTSELMQRLFRDHKEWFSKHINKLIVTQRGDEVPEVYRDLHPVSISLDCSNPQHFRQRLTEIVAEHGTKDRPMHVFPSYGVFRWNYAPKNPVFSFHDDSLQINLNARLQVIDAFRAYKDNTTFHLFGSLFANFPYTGDYSLSMWYINQLPRNAEYQDLQLKIYNLGGMKTRFWKHAEGPKNNPFLHDDIPSQALFNAAFRSSRKGIFMFYPSFLSRIACFLGARGVRVL
ncbi:MAG: hypothetical protein H6728_10865 [Myxococcales bacterium]|nr:hypothetical protein [Myxococcales bacterium]